MKSHILRGSAEGSVDEEDGFAVGGSNHVGLNEAQPLLRVEEFVDLQEV